MNVKNLIFVCCVTGLCLACSPRAIREARDVVAQADSLWQAGQMYGVDAGDSATLAQAYETLGKFSVFSIQLSEIFPFGHRTSSPHTFSHVCYHYGRLLRAKEDPVSAMQVFINATHSHTRDYHILGRVYSNMGDIAHLAGEYSLSYDMYEKSGEMYLKNGDTLLYYYDLNNMAFELVMLGKKEEALALLDIAEKQNTYSEVSFKIIETKVACAMLDRDYYSAVSYIDYLQQQGIQTSNLIIAKAQAFYYIHKYDSAKYYAEGTIKESNSPYEKDNAYYILIHCDSIHAGGKIHMLNAARADVEKDIEKRFGKLSQATQLLEQDLNSKYDWSWLIAIVGTIIITALVIIIYRRSQRKKHNLLSQKVEDLSNAYSDIQSNKLANIERVSETLRTSPAFTKDICWRDYNKMCTIADNHFYLITTKLKQKQILNEQEIRLCILVLINYNNNSIAQILSYAPSGIGKLKYRVAQKLGIESKNLRKYLLSVAIDEPFAP